MRFMALDLGNPLIKSIKIDFKALIGINSWRNPASNQFSVEEILQVINFKILNIKIYINKLLHDNFILMILFYFFYLHFFLLKKSGSTYILSYMKY